MIIAIAEYVEGSHPVRDLVWLQPKKTTLLPLDRVVGFPGQLTGIDGKTCTIVNVKYAVISVENGKAVISD